MHLVNDFLSYSASANLCEQVLCSGSYHVTSARANRRETTGASIAATERVSEAYILPLKERLKERVRDFDVMKLEFFLLQLHTKRKQRRFV